MNLADIVENFLNENDYDGLVNLEGECACSLDDQLFPCETPDLECEGGYKHYCSLCTEDKSKCSFSTDPNEPYCFKRERQKDNFNGQLNICTIERKREPE